MKINKELKFATFSYDEDSKIFTIEDQHGNLIELNKVYSFAFMRFVVRMAQRNWLRSPKKLKKIVDTPHDDMLSLDDGEIIESNQMIFKEIKNDDNLGV